MRTITKLQEPDSLAQLRAKPGAVFDERGLESSPVLPDGNPILSKDDKRKLRERLCEEQRSLCCYCCCRIEPTQDGMRIEHWKPLRRFPAEQLDYRNLMAACTGCEDQAPHLRHCDVRKGQLDLSKNPSNPQHRINETIHYLTDGSIRASDATFDAELGEDPKRVKQNSERVLNLNLPFLRRNRIDLLNGFTKGLERRGKLQKLTIERLLVRWRGDDGGTLDPYSPIVVRWLEKRLARP